MPSLLESLIEAVNVQLEAGQWANVAMLTVELYAAAVYLSPLLLSTFDRVVDELLSVHERWVDARVGEARLAYEAEQARQAPALELVGALEQKEQALARLLETA